MITFENKIKVNRPVKEVFSFISHFENIPKWNYFVKSVKPISTDAPREGSVYHQIRKTDDQHFKITRFNPNHNIAVQTLEYSRPFFEIRFSFEPTKEGTLVMDEWRLDTEQPAVLEKLFKSKVKNAVKENLKKLKQLLEQGQVHLQDGRVLNVDDKHIIESMNSNDKGVK